MTDQSSNATSRAAINKASERRSARTKEGLREQIAIQDLVSITDPFALEMFLDKRLTAIYGDIDPEKLAGHRERLLNSISVKQVRLERDKLQMQSSGELETLVSASSDTVPRTAGPEQLQAGRKQRVVAAQTRWFPTAHRRIPFAWIHAAAGVDHKDAYNWKSGKLPDTSAMAKSIDRVLQQTKPPTAPISK